jgi:hypothetical protein
MLEDLRGFLDAPKLTLPIGGKNYIVEPVTAETWLKLVHFSELVASNADKPEATTDEIAQMSEIDLFKLCLGTTFDVLAKVVNRNELRTAGLTAFYWQLGREDVAESMWRLEGKATAPKAAPKRSTRTTTAAASTTRKRASTSGTRSRPK